MAKNTVTKFATEAMSNMHSHSCLLLVIRHLVTRSILYKNDKLSIIARELEPFVNRIKVAEKNNRRE